MGKVAENFIKAPNHEDGETKPIKIHVTIAVNKPGHKPKRNNEINQGTATKSILIPHAVGQKGLN